MNNPTTEPHYSGATAQRAQEIYWNLTRLPKHQWVEIISKLSPALKKELVKLIQNKRTTAASQECKPSNGQMSQKPQLGANTTEASSEGTQNLSTPRGKLAGSATDEVPSPTVPPPDTHTLFSASTGPLSIRGPGNSEGTPPPRATSPDISRAAVSNISLAHRSRSPPVSFADPAKSGHSTQKPSTSLPVHPLSSGSQRATSAIRNGAPSASFSSPSVTRSAAVTSLALQSPALASVSASNISLMGSPAPANHFRPSLKSLAGAAQKKTMVEAEARPSTCTATSRPSEDCVKSPDSAHLSENVDASEASTGVSLQASRLSPTRQTPPEPRSADHALPLCSEPRDSSVAQKRVITDFLSRKEQLVDVGDTRQHQLNGSKLKPPLCVSPALEKLSENGSVGVEHDSSAQLLYENAPSSCCRSPKDKLDAASSIFEPESRGLLCSSFVEQNGDQPLAMSSLSVGGGPPVDEQSRGSQPCMDQARIRAPVASATFSKKRPAKEMPNTLPSTLISTANSQAQRKYEPAGQPEKKKTKTLLAFSDVRRDATLPHGDHPEAGMSTVPTTTVGEGPCSPPSLALAVKCKTEAAHDSGAGEGLLDETKRNATCLSSNVVDPAPTRSLEISSSVPTSQETIALQQGTRAVTAMASQVEERDISRVNCEKFSCHQDLVTETPLAGSMCLGEDVGVIRNDSERHEEIDQYVRSPLTRPDFINECVVDEEAIIHLDDEQEIYYSSSVVASDSPAANSLVNHDCYDAAKDAQRSVSILNPILKTQDVVAVSHSSGGASDTRNTEVGALPGRATTLVQSFGDTNGLVSPLSQNLPRFTTRPSAGNSAAAAQRFSSVFSSLETFVFLRVDIDSNVFKLDSQLHISGDHSNALDASESIAKRYLHFWTSVLTAAILRYGDQRETREATVSPPCGDSKRSNKEPALKSNSFSQSSIPASSWLVSKRRRETISKEYLLTTFPIERLRWSQQQTTTSSDSLPPREKLERGEIASYIRRVQASRRGRVIHHLACPKRFRERRVFQERRCHAFTPVEYQRFCHLRNTRSLQKRFAKESLRTLLGCNIAAFLALTGAEEPMLGMRELSRFFNFQMTDFIAFLVADRTALLVELALRVRLALDSLSQRDCDINIPSTEDKNPSIIEDTITAGDGSAALSPERVKGVLVQLGRKPWLFYALYKTGFRLPTLAPTRRATTSIAQEADRADSLAKIPLLPEHYEIGAALLVYYLDASIFKDVLPHMNLMDVYHNGLSLTSSLSVQAAWDAAIKLRDSQPGLLPPAPSETTSQKFDSSKIPVEETTNVHTALETSEPKMPIVTNNLKQLGSDDPPAVDEVIKDSADATAPSPLSKAEEMMFNYVVSAAVQKSSLQFNPPSELTTFTFLYCRDLFWSLRHAPIQTVREKAEERLATFKNNSSQTYKTFQEHYRKEFRLAAFSSWCDEVSHDLLHYPRDNIRSIMRATLGRIVAYGAALHRIVALGELFTENVAKAPCHPVNHSRDTNSTSGSDSEEDSEGIEASSNSEETVSDISDAESVGIKKIDNKDTRSRASDSDDADDNKKTVSTQECEDALS